MIRISRTTHRPSAWLAIVLFALGVLALDLAGVETGALLPADRGLELAVHRFLGSSTFPFFTVVSFFGDGAVRTVVSALVVVALLARRLRRAAVLVVAVVGGTALLDQVMKIAVARPRPHLFAGALHASGYSFPSGHAADSTAFFGVLAFLAWRLSDRRRVAGVAALVAAACIGAVCLSRVVLGVHYPTDVVGGAALGVAWLGAMILILYVGHRVRGAGRQGKDAARGEDQPFVSVVGG